MKEETAGRPGVIGGVDTHKDLHMAAVVDEHDRVLGSGCFATTRHGYKQMLIWMRSFGELLRVGVECTGTYGAGLLRYLQQAEVRVLEVTAPDRSDRRKRGKLRLEYVSARLRNGDRVASVDRRRRDGDYMIVAIQNLDDHAGERRSAGRDCPGDPACRRRLCGAERGTR